MGKTNRTVVRNERYRKNEVAIRERHNERKNEIYSNPDVLLAYSKNNVVFKACDTTYRQKFEQMQADGIISTRGLKADAYVFDELVFDVNTDYFEQNGGYEFAKRFYAEAYELAKEIVGGEQYILSAVMHADERNREASERLGRDVFHYHLHVMYIPVVKKDILWSKRTKDPALRGKVRETITQVSHSKKWPFVPLLDERGQPVLKKNGKPRLISSYHYLQTAFYEHMKQAGFPDLERGIEGSNAQHLNVLAFKIEQDRRQVQTLAQQIDALSAQAQKAVQRRDHAEREAVSAEGRLRRTQASKAEVAAITSRSRKKMLGKTVELPQEDYDRLHELAEQTPALQNAVERLQVSEEWLQEENKRLDEKYRALVKQYNVLYEQVEPYLQAVRLAPDRIAAAIGAVFRQYAHAQEQHHEHYERPHDDMTM